MVQSKAHVVRDVYPSLFNASRGNTGLLGCYCSRLMFNDPAAVLRETFPVPQQSVAFEPFARGALNATATRAEELCVDWFVAQAAVQLISFSAVMAVVGVNFVLRFVLRRMVAREGHHSHSSMLASLTFKLFLSQARARRAARGRGMSRSDRLPCFFRPPTPCPGARAAASIEAGGSRPPSPHPPPARVRPRSWSTRV